MTKFNFTTEKKAAYKAVTVLTTGSVSVMYFADWASFIQYYNFYKNTPIKVSGFHKNENGWGKLDIFTV